MSQLCKSSVSVIVFILEARTGNVYEQQKLREEASFSFSSDDFASD